MGIQLNVPVRVGDKPSRLSGSAANPRVEALRHNERLVFNALSDSETPQKAYDLLDKLQDDGLRAPMTIYRALEALIAKGCVRKIESLNAFAAIREDHADCVLAFLICRDCMRVREVPLDRQQVAGLFAPLSVSSEDVRIEVMSDCEQIGCE